MKFISLATLSLVIISFGCSTLRVKTDYVHGVDFSSYKTFTIKSDAPLKNLTDSESIENSLGITLQARGLSPLPLGGDLLVVPHFQLEKEMKAQTTNYGFGGWERMGSTPTGTRTGGVQSGTTTFSEVPIGTIVITMVDAKSNTIIWRGIAKDQFSLPMAPGEWKLMADRAFLALLRNFPPKG